MIYQPHPWLRYTSKYGGRDWRCIGEALAILIWKPAETRRNCEENTSKWPPVLCVAMCQPSFPFSLNICRLGGMLAFTRFIRDLEAAIKYLGGLSFPRLCAVGRIRMKYHRRFLRQKLEYICMASIVTHLVIKAAYLQTGPIEP